MERGPVFIGGLAHSGKTALRLALAAHCDIALSRRTYMWNRFYGRYGDLAVEGNFERCLAEMLKVRAIRALCDDVDTIRAQFWQGEPVLGHAHAYGRLFSLFHEQYARRTGKSRWGDQLGFVERFADAIFEAYPTARMIHMMRDPRDSCEASMRLARFRSGKVGWETARWLCSAELAQRNQALYAGRYKVVQFETLALEPERTLRQLCDFLGERYEPAMVQTIAAHDADKRGRGNPARERRLSAPELAFSQEYARRKLQALGYALRPTPLSWRDRMRYALVDWPLNRAGMAAWRRYRRGRSETTFERGTNVHGGLPRPYGEACL